MSDNLYEGMFLLDSGRFAADPDGVTARLLGLLESAGATVAAHRPWQDGRLAYEIQGHRKGLHYLVYFRMGGEGHTELTRLCKLSDMVMRHLVIRHPQSLFDVMVAALTDQTETSETSETSKTADASAEGQTAESSSSSDQPQEAVAAVAGETSSNE